MERPVQTDLTDRYAYRFKGGMEPKRLVISNASADTNLYVAFRADDGNAPDERDFDVVVPHGATLELEDISVSVLVTSYTATVGIFKY